MEHFDARLFTLGSLYRQFLIVDLSAEEAPWLVNQISSLNYGKSYLNYTKKISNVYYNAANLVKLLNLIVLIKFIVNISLSM